MEWSLIRELDEAYFFSDSNIKYIYQIYNFPRLTESENIQSIKTEIKVFLFDVYRHLVGISSIYIFKGLLAARSIWLLLGKERFQEFIMDWLTVVQKSQLDHQTIETDIRSHHVHNVSILTHLEKVLYIFN